MLATRAPRPFHRPGWIYEEKVDGWRMLAYKDGSKVRLLSRHGVDHTARFADIAAAVRNLRPSRLILDGEITVFDEDLVSQFHLLSEPDPAVLTTPPLYMAFDCLWLGGRDMRGEPLSRRRKLLEESVEAASLILPIRRLPADGFEAWEVVKARGYEGLLAKDDGSRYQAGESRRWIKVKFRQEGRFVVGGIGQTQDGAPSLLIGERINGRAVYRGSVEIGVGPRLVATVLERARVRATPPFGGLNPSGVTWVDPTVQVGVSYGRVMQGWLREPACRGLVGDD